MNLLRLHQIYLYFIGLRIVIRLRFRSFNFIFKSVKLLGDVSEQQLFVLLPFNVIDYVLLTQKKNIY